MPQSYLYVLCNMYISYKVVKKLNYTAALHSIKDFDLRYMLNIEDDMIFGNRPNSIYF